MSRSRKSLLFFTVCALLVSLVGCINLPLSNKPPIPDADTYIAAFRDKPYYQALSTDMRTCYGSVYTALTDGFATDETVTITREDGTTQTDNGIRITLPGILANREQAQALYNAVFYDNPHFFYMNNLYGLEGYSKDGKPYYDTLVLTYAMNAAERQDAKTKLDATMDSIIGDMPQATDDYTKEWYLHEQLLSRCTYDTQAAENGFSAHPTAYTAYGALIEGKAVCEGYSRAMQWLLNESGIRCIPVSGESLESGEQHMWNVVTINGNDYHLDATWNDNDDKPRHNYFNVTTAQISLSHRIDDNQPVINTCTATEDNYYVRNGLYIDTYRRQEIAAAIAKQIKAGSTQIELLFAADKFDSAVLFLKSRSAAEEMINPYLADSGLSLWPYTLYGESDEHILWIRKEE